MATQDIHTAKDMATFGLDLAGGTSYTSYLGTLRMFKADLSGQMVDAKTLTQMYGQSQEVGAMATYDFQLMSVVSGSTKVSNLDISAFTIGGNSYLPVLKSYDATITWEHTGKVGTQRWHYAALKNKTLMINCKVSIPATSAAFSKTLQVAMGSSTVADRQLAVTITINGISVTTAMLLTKVTQSGIDINGEQVLDISLENRALDATTFPGAPTGTTTILEKVANSTSAWGLHALTKTTDGADYVGLVLPKSYKLSAPQSGLVVEDFSVVGIGTQTIS